MMINKYIHKITVTVDDNYCCLDYHQNTNTKFKVHDMASQHLHTKISKYKVN